LSSKEHNNDTDEDRSIMQCGILSRAKNINGTKLMFTVQPLKATHSTQMSDVLGTRRSISRRDDTMMAPREQRLSLPSLLLLSHQAKHQS